MYNLFAARLLLCAVFCLVATQASADDRFSFGDNLDALDVGFLS